MNLEYILIRLIEDTEKEHKKNPKHKTAVIISKLKECLEYAKTKE